MTDTIIQLKDILFAYHKSQFSIMCDNLELKAKEVTVFTGKNGSGKTTLLKLCCGILKPSKGSLYIDGEDAKKWSLGKIGGNIGYLFQEPSHQLFTATVWDEMTFIGRILEKDTDEIQKRAITLLKRFNLIDLIERSIYKLSRGEKQRLAIAAILMQDIRYLILDEPTTGLDKQNKVILYEMIDSLVNDGMGIAIISHNKELISRYKDRQIVVDKGKVIV
ncbi:MAG: ABC transporter ATP-binding protein [Eubacteriales bacterium]